MSIIKVKTGGITADAITDALIADDVVGTEHLTANEVDTTALGADAVTAAQIADDAISEEHLDVTAITGHTAETSIADGDTLLIHDASASALRKMTKANFVSGIGGANTPAFFVELNGSQSSVSDDTFTKVAYNNEEFDTANAFDSSTNYRFTTPSDGAGKYVFFAQVDVDSEGNSNLDNSTFQFKKNNSVIRSQEYNHLSNPPRNHAVFSTILESMSAGDYMEIFVRIEASDASGGRFNGTNTWFGGYKIIE